MSSVHSARRGHTYSNVQQYHARGGSLLEKRSVSSQAELLAVLRFLHQFKMKTVALMKNA